MPTVEPLHVRMVEQSLRNLYGKALTDNERQMCEVRFEYTERFGCSMVFEIGTGGDEHDILQMYCYTNRRFTPSAFDGILRFCNDWNTNSRWPRAYMYTVAPDEGSDEQTMGRITLDYHLLAEGGIYQEMVESLYIHFYRGCCQFWEEFHALEGQPESLDAPHEKAIATAG